jgi:hypothetical protein
LEVQDVALWASASTLTKIENFRKSCFFTASEVVPLILHKKTALRTRSVSQVPEMQVPEIRETLMVENQSESFLSAAIPVNSPSS